MKNERELFEEWWNKIVGDGPWTTLERMAAHDAWMERAVLDKPVDSSFAENQYAQALNVILDFLSGSKLDFADGMRDMIKSTFKLVESSKTWQPVEQAPIAVDPKDRSQLLRMAGNMFGDIYSANTKIMPRQQCTIEEIGMVAAKAALATMAAVDKLIEEEK